jgi:hypothetical protein
MYNVLVESKKDGKQGPFKQLAMPSGSRVIYTNPDQRNYVNLKNETRD